MPRNISFALTTPQVRARTKTVTRRTGWNNLAAGDELVAIVKGMGLKKGERVERLAHILVTEVRHEPLRHLVENPAYGRAEVDAEGFPLMTVARFVDFFCSTHRGVGLDTPLTRIAFRYL